MYQANSNSSCKWLWNNLLGMFDERKHDSCGILLSSSLCKPIIINKMGRQRATVYTQQWSKHELTRKSLGLQCNMQPAMIKSSIGFIRFLFSICRWQSEVPATSKQATVRMTGMMYPLTWLIGCSYVKSAIIRKSYVPACSCVMCSNVVVIIEKLNYRCSNLIDSIEKVLLLPRLHLASCNSARTSAESAWKN